MKNFIRVLSFISFTIVVYLTGCSSDENENPLSFIDGYSVDLLESEGTTYSGDYFPLEEGYTLNYTGSVDMLTEMTIPGYDPIEEPTISPALGMLKVLPLRDIPLASALISLYPIVDLSEIQGEIASDTSRFFNKDAEAVYVKAIKMSDGSYLEVEDPVYIKSSLVVGESWNTAPKMDMTKLLAGELSDGVGAEDLTLKAESKFFVVGHEMISLPIGNKWAMRMEQANDITMTGTLLVEGSSVDMTTTAKLSTVYHLIADTGIVHQNTAGPMNMKMTVEGQSITIKITINKSELNLISLGDGGFYKMPVSEFDDHMIDTRELQSFKTRTNLKIWKLSHVLTNLLIKKLSF
jgi:hypothetical protein